MPLNKRTIDSRAASSPLTPILECNQHEEWAQWLGANHAASSGVWLSLPKKIAGVTALTYDEALEEALCYGWIDSQKRSHNATRWLQRFSPRKPRSIWSKANREKIEALTRAGRMHPAGLVAVEQARQNGRWDAAYDAQGSAAVPDDLQAALKRKPRAAKFFASLDSRNRYAILHRLQTVRKAETRERRLADFVAMLERGETIYPPPRSQTASRAKNTAPRR